MINISVVLYKTPRTDVAKLYASLKLATTPWHLIFVDNSPSPCIDPQDFPGAEYLHMPSNPGYGAGHNLALRQSVENNVAYHLVVNPDVELQSGCLETITEFMDANPWVGQVMPRIIGTDGAVQYLCKLLPSPLDMFGRRFLGRIFRRWIEQRNSRYELRDHDYGQMMDIPNLSGCFMFFRTRIVAAAGLFDERYFMYAEDMDLTRRVHRIARTVYLPAACAMHVHARESYGRGKMMWVHMQSIVKYFNKWGWFMDRERRQINRRTLQRLAGL